MGKHKSTIKTQRKAIFMHEIIMCVSKKMSEIKITTNATRRVSPQQLGGGLGVKPSN